MAAVNKVREELAQAFLAALKEEQLPWRACWAQGRPYNAATGRRYKGINTLRLSMLADERGYKDPRWCTFQQAKDKGWKIRKGEHATKVEYWAMYDMERKRWMNWNEVERLKRDDPDAADKLQLRSRTALVFNAAQMEGVPPLPQRPRTDIGQLRQQRDTLLENMQLAYREEGTRAYYSPSADMVTLPPEASFDDPYSYISTFLHECGHATGHPDRLNRHIENHFGSEDYAREELRAEIASAFVSQELGLEMSQKALNEHFDLHKAYIQSWIKVLEKDPQELFAAIKDASGIANYLMEKGEFLQNITEEKRQIRHIEAENIDQEKFDFYAKDPVDLRFVGCTFRNVTVSESEARLSQFKDCKFYGCDTRSVQDRSVFTHAAFFPADAAVRQPERRESKYIPADMIELARSQDVFDILQRTGEPLFQKDGQWRSVEHDSLVVTPGKGYYWFSRAEGSKSPIDYFVNVHGMGFQEAVRTVLEAIHRDVTYTPPVWLPPAEHEEFRPLPRAKTNLDAYNYLVQERGLDQELVDGLMRQGRIYQSGKYKNVVFVGTDFDGVVASNFARSCNPTQQVQRFDVRGSQKEYRFRMENPDCPRCNVFESEIDLLSYLSMRPADQRTENYIALGGVSPRALLAFLQYRPDVSQINLCTDGDRAGEQCAESIRTLLEGQYEISREAAPIGKDWNESLVRIRELQESWEHETNDPETETWRDDLTSQEAQIVAAWDDGFDHGLARMVTLSRTQDDPGLRSAMAKLDPVEQVRSPFARKAEDWTY